MLHIQQKRQRAEAFLQPGSLGATHALAAFVFRAVLIGLLSNEKLFGNLDLARLKLGRSTLIPLNMTYLVGTEKVCSRNL